MIVRKSVFNRFLRRLSGLGLDKYRNGVPRREAATAEPRNTETSARLVRDPQDEENTAEEVGKEAADY